MQRWKDGLWKNQLCSMQKYTSNQSGKKSYYLNRIFKNLDFEAFWDSFISKDVAI